MDEVASEGLQIADVEGAGGGPAEAVDVEHGRSGNEEGAGPVEHLRDGGVHLVA
jgi:hypothetical protein